MLGVLIEEDLGDHAFTDAHVVDVDQVVSTLRNVPIAACCAHAGLDEALVRRATRRVFDEETNGEGLASVVEAFNQGWQVEVGPMMPAADYLDGLDEIPGLREAAAGLAGGDSPARLASAIEFILEGLHLHNRLNKREGESGARFQAA